MSGPGPLATALERTRALVAPPSGADLHSVGTAARLRLTAALPPLVERLPAGDQVVVTVPTLRQALVDPDRLARPEEPFRWKSAFVRRSLGLAVVEACASGRFRAPARAVGPIADEAVAEWERTGWRTFHWEPWLAGLTSGARAMVLADAVGWATGVWSLLDWRSLASDAQVGGAYDQWVSPAPRTIRLKARSEVRVPIPGSDPDTAHEPTSGPRTALVSVSGGCPTPGWADELAYLALVAGLRSTSRPVPARVMGLWPDAGIHRCVEIDAVALDRVTDRVVATVAAVVEARLAAVPAD